MNSIIVTLVVLHASCRPFPEFQCAPQAVWVCNAVAERCGLGNASSTFVVLGKGDRIQERDERRLYLEAYFEGWKSFDSYADSGDGLSSDLSVPFVQGCDLQIKARLQGLRDRKSLELNTKNPRFRTSGTR